MASSGHARVLQDDWDHVWQDYDRQNLGTAALKQPEVAYAVASPVPSRSGFRGALLALGCCLLLTSQTNVHEATSHPSAAVAFASLLSLAPEEAELPPLTASVSRLAVESTAAACWVLQLAPPNLAVAQALTATPGIEQGHYPDLPEAC